MALQEIDNDVHRIVANIITGIAGNSSSPAEIEIQIRREQLSATWYNRLCLIAFVIPSLIDRDRLDSQKPAFGTLT